MKRPSDPTNEGQITTLLHRLQSGDNAAELELIPLIYAEMRYLAARLMGTERSGHTLQPTALVHEAYMRIFKAGRINWKSRAHFFAVAAQAMRRILIDNARSHRSAKRGGGRQKVPLDDTILKSTYFEIDLLVLDEALDRLAEVAPRPCRVVEMVFFGGMTMEDTALVLGVSEKTIKRDWAAARAWLYKEIYGTPRSLGQSQ
jgi:RNA polymerase sigma factor (TIGR02999 family)